MKRDELKKRFEAMTDALSEEKLRWLIGKSKPFIETGEMTPEEYETLMENILRTEMERKMIINELKSGSLITSEISRRLKLPPKQVFKHLKVLRRLNIVAVIGEREGELEFQSLL